MCAPGLSRKLKKDYNFFVEHKLDFKTPTDNFFTLDLDPDPMN